MNWSESPRPNNRKDNMTPWHTEAIAKRSTITELCNAWTQSADDLQKGFALLAGAQKRMSDFFDGGNRSFSIYGGSHYHSLDFNEPAPWLDYFQRQVWRALVDRLGLRRILSLKRIEEMENQIEKGKDLPAITVENVTAMLETNANRMGEYLQEKVHEVYEWLRPGTWSRSKYVTNQKSEEAGVGRKVIKCYAVRHSYAGSGFEVEYRTVDRLRALDQVFHLLDGAAKWDDSYDGELVNAIRDQTKATDSRPATNCFETKYFKGKCFGNGNLHLEIRRQDLLDKFNVMAGGPRITDEKKFN